MSKKRVFKTKTFARWAKGLLTDTLLCVAAKEIMQGQYEAELGSDFSDVQVDAAKMIGAALQKSSIISIEELIADGVLKEICHEDC